MAELATAERKALEQERFQLDKDARTDVGLSPEVGTDVGAAADAALAAGADPQDIANLSQELIDVEEVDIKNVSFDVGVGEDLSFDFEEEDTRIPTPPKVASEKAAYTAVLKGLPHFMADYTAMKMNMMSQGADAEVEAMEEVLFEEHQRRAIETAAMLAAEKAEDPKLLLNTALNSIEEYQPSLADEMSVRLAASATPTTKEGMSVQQAFIDGLDEELESYGNLEQMVREEADLSMSWGVAIDFLSTFAPLYEGVAFGQFLSEMELDVDAAGVLLPGELLVKVRKHVNSLSPAERVDFFKDATTYLRESAGVLGTNEFVKADLLYSTFREAIGDLDPNDIDWDRWLRNVGGFMDSSIFLAPIYRGVKAAVHSVRGSRMQRMIDANRNAAADITGAVAAGTDEAAEILGETQASIRAKHVLPKDAEWDAAQTPEALRREVLARDADTLEVSDAADELSRWVGKEGQEAANEFRRLLEDASDGTVWIADTGLSRTAAGWRADALVANSPESGWASLEAVKAANKELFGGKGRIVERKKFTDRVRVVDTTGDKPKVRVTGEEESSEFFIRVSHERKIVFDDSDFAISVGGDKSGYLFSPDSRFAKWISTKGNAVFDQYKRLEKTIELRFNPIAALKDDGKLLVSKVLSRGLQREKVYNDREIERFAKAFGIKEAAIPKVVEAYREARRGFDTMYLLEERIFRRNLEKDNFTGVIRTEGYRDFVRPARLSDVRDIKRVFNPNTQKIEDAPDIEELYANGGELLQTRSAFRADGEQARYIVKQPGQVVEDLPTFTLNYHEGWLPTMYKENYFVTRTTTVMENDKPVQVENAIEVARTKPEALARVKRLNENAEEGVEYDFKHDRRLTSDQSEDMQMDLSQGLGKLFFSRRGERLKHEDGSLGRIQDPLEAAMNATRSISRRVAMREFIEDLKTRYVNTFGHMTGNKFAKPNLNNLKDATQDNIQRAGSMYAYINQLEGNVLMFNHRRQMVRLADWLDKIGSNSAGKTRAGFKQLADGARWMSDKDDAISWARAKNFELNLGTDPVRQLLLQPSQILFTAALDPLNVVRNFNAGRVISKLVDDGVDRTLAEWNEVARTQTRGNFTGEELRDLVEEYRQTGLGQAVTSHQVARDSATPMSIQASGNKVEKVLQTVSSIYTKPVSLARAIGFERGEEINLGVHWMLARARWMKNNPGKDPSENVFEIGGEARALALSMTQAGDFSYQRGLLSLPLQYFAVRHKALMAMISNQQLTAAERRRLVYGQLALWGPEGLALGAFVRWAEENWGLSLDSQAEQVLQDGIMETFMNSALSGVSGEDVDLDFAGTFSPVKGVLTDNIVTDMYELITNGGDFGDLLIGATANNLNRISQFGSSLNVVFGIAPPEANLEAGGVAFEEGLRVFSSLNRGMQGWAMLKHRAWLNSKGEEVLEAGIVESLAQGVLGLQSNKVEALFQLQRILNPPGINPTTEIEEEADTYYRIALRMTTDALSVLNDGGDMVKVKANLAAQQRVLRLLYETHPNAAAIMERVKNKVDNNLKKDKQDKLLDTLSRLHLHNGNQNLIEIAAQRGLVDPETAEKLLEIYNYSWDFE